MASTTRATSSGWADWSRPSSSRTQTKRSRWPSRAVRCERLLPRQDQGGARLRALRPQVEGAEAAHRVEDQRRLQAALQRLREAAVGGPPPEDGEPPDHPGERDRCAARGQAGPGPEREGGIMTRYPSRIELLAAKLNQPQSTVLQSATQLAAGYAASATNMGAAGQELIVWAAIKTLDQLVAKLIEEVQPVKPPTKKGGGE